jgi:hypothetical protein
VPAAPSVDTSTVSAGNATSIVSATDIELPLQASLRDAFGNEVLDALGVVVRVQGLDPADPAAVVKHDLDGPRYSHPVTVPQGLESMLNISFSLDDVQIGEPIEITVTPPARDHTPVYVAVSISSFLLLVGAFFYRRHQLRAAAQLKKVELEMAGQDVIFSEKRKEMEQDKQNLEAEKDQLEEEMRRKKHSEEELKVMVEALQSVSKERQDELKEVMVDSKEVTVDRMLGKGG